MPAKPKLLIFLMFPEHVRLLYRDRLAAKYPEMDVDVVATREECAEAIEGADILLTFGAMMRDWVYRKAGRLRWLHALGTGVDGITDCPSLRREVIVTSTRGIHGIPLSEAGFMMMLALSRDLPRSLRAQAKGAWERWPARLLHNKTVGIFGIGLIAEEMAPRFKAFGMHTVGITRTPREVTGIDRFVTRDELEDIVAELDYLVLLIALTEETRTSVDERILKAMKPTSCLINLARGGVVDEAALARALDEGWIGGAGLDTFLEEPLPPDHPLWKAPNTIITPHLAGFNDAYPDHALPQFEANLRSFLSGEMDRMINVEERV
jgi:phosphoglycerate dehydrogenase-like enzyme